jgi:hypothetical protein
MVASEGEMADALWLSGSAFNTLGVRAGLGRLYTAIEDARDGGPSGPVAVISHAMWRRRFAGSPAVVGSRIMVERVPFTIVRVTPPDFLASRWDVASIWLFPSTHSPWSEALAGSRGIRGGCVSSCD